MPWQEESPLSGALGFASAYVASQQARQDALAKAAQDQAAAQAQAQQQTFANQLALQEYGLKKSADTREQELQPSKIAAQSAAAQKTQADATLANIDAQVKQGTAPAVIASAYSDALIKKYGVSKAEADGKVAQVVAAYAGANAQAGLAKTKQELDNLYLTGQSTVVNMARTQADTANTQQQMGFSAQLQPGKVAAQNLGNVKSLVDTARTYGDITGTNVGKAGAGGKNPSDPAVKMGPGYAAARDAYAQAVTRAKANSPLGTLPADFPAPPIDPDDAIAHAQQAAANLQSVPKAQRQAAYQKALQTISRNYPPYARASMMQAFVEAVAGKPAGTSSSGGGSTAANPFLASLGL